MRDSDIFRLNITLNDRVSRESDYLMLFKMV